MPTCWRRRLDIDGRPRVTGAAALAADLVDLLDVACVGTDQYRGRRSTGGVGRVFGGQVVAQALQAAQRAGASDGRVAHSLHACFIRAGSEAHPVDYHVSHEFDGRSFATRRVVATQGDQAILSLTASFHRPEPGLHHQDAMPDVPAPDTLRSEADLRATVADQIPDRFRAALTRPRAIEFRPVVPRRWTDPAPTAPVQHAWFRVVAPIGDDPAMHQAVLAYASDMTLLSTCMLPHGVTWITPGVQTASLDHALWLHEPLRADEWLLYATDSPWAGNARGMNRGRIFSADGRLVASVAQEGLFRRRAPPR